MIWQQNLLHHYPKEGSFNQGTFEQICFYINITGFRFPMAALFLPIIYFLHHSDLPVLPKLSASCKCQHLGSGDLLHLAFSDPRRSPGDGEEATQVGILN